MKNMFALDIGFGHVKFAFFNKSKNISCFKFPSVVAVSDTLDSSYLFHDGRYIVGDQAFKYDRSKIIDMTDYRTLLKFSPLFLHYALGLAKNDGFSYDNRLMICTDISFFFLEYKERFLESLRVHVVNNVTYNYGVDFIFQGVGAVYALEYLQSKSSKIALSNDFLVVDIGFNTIDFVFYENGQVVENRFDSSYAFDSKGSIFIAKKMIDYIQESFNRTITTREALKIVSDCTYRLRGENHDLSSVVAGFKQEYTAFLMDFLESKYAWAIDDMEQIHFVGGGAYFVDAEYSKNFIVHEKCEYFNVIGNLLSIKTST